MDLEKYAQEMEVAVKAVHMASLLCRRVQESLISNNNVHVQSKEDDSPVTVAGMIPPPQPLVENEMALLLFFIIYLFLFFVELLCYLEMERCRLPASGLCFS